MREYLEIGSTPCDEDCAQVGSPDYYERAKKECSAYINQLIRLFGEGSENNKIGIKSFPHDFGSYYEVVVYYDSDDKSSIDYAFGTENNSPLCWDEEAKKELQSQESK